jgi:hypothetical protein
MNTYAYIYVYKQNLIRIYIVYKYVCTLFHHKHMCAYLHIYIYIHVVQWYRMLYYNKEYYIPVRNTKSQQRTLNLSKKNFIPIRITTFHLSILYSDNECYPLTSNTRIAYLNEKHLKRSCFNE